MAKRLTDIAIRNLKPRATRVELPDAGSGLYLVLQPSGHRSFAVRYRANNQPKKLTIGSWPAVSLADARVAAIKARERVKQGEDPAKKKADDKIKADAAKEDTVTAVCEKYLARPEVKKLRTNDQRVSILRRLIYPVLGDKPIGSVKRSDIVTVLDRVEDRNGPRAADVCLAVLRRVMNWFALRDDEFRSPIVRGMNRQRAAEHRRERVLDDSEIRKVWGATADGQPFSALVRFALLTSARRSEIAGLRWDEVSPDGIWTLPASRSKTKTEIVRPLSKAAQEVLTGLPRFEGCDFAFTTTGRTPISQFSVPKARLDAASGVTGWRLHDLRRTARSLLSRAKVPTKSEEGKVVHIPVNPDVAERCLGHALPGIRATYDKHRYIFEMTHAFEALSALIGRIVNPPPVADMAAERRKRRR
jgi:integrase